MEQMTVSIGGILLDVVILEHLITLRPIINVYVVG